MSYQNNTFNRVNIRNGNSVIYTDMQRCYEKYVNQIRRKTSQLAFAVTRNINEAITHLVQIENESCFNHIVELEQSQQVNDAKNETCSKMHHEKLKFCNHKEVLYSETNQSVKSNNNPYSTNTNMQINKNDSNNYSNKNNHANVSNHKDSSNTATTATTTITTKTIATNNMPNNAHAIKTNKFTPNK